jgi:hypothetical protein
MPGALWTLFLSGMALDAITTLVGLNAGLYEGNPIFAWINHQGPWAQAGIIIGAKAVASLSIYAMISKVPASWSKAWLVAATGALFAIVAWNAHLIAGVIH